ncbi:MAG: tRNA lysidine(34) synthetase TilS, partial [Clostridiales bacterium]|nr:tRNA lysidine(34) synthetase TilS [Clostridiales bacterium]
MIEEKALNTIKKYDLLEYGDTVILGVSGGADSMALAYFMNSLKEEYGLKLIIAHINHCIRGAEADSDEEFVKNQAEKLGIEFRSLRADVPSIAKLNSEGTEECGRRIRYEFFNSISGNAKIATAHNLNDKMETFFLNLARGTSLKGLCSIPVKRDNIIRPLIDCSRREIEEYC